MIAQKLSDFATESSGLTVITSRVIIVGSRQSHLPLLIRFAPKARFLHPADPAPTHENPQ